MSCPRRQTATTHLAEHFERQHLNRLELSSVPALLLLFLVAVVALPGSLLARFRLLLGRVGLVARLACRRIVVVRVCARTLAFPASWASRIESYGQSGLTELARNAPLTFVRCRATLLCVHCLVCVRRICLAVERIGRDAIARTASVLDSLRHALAFAQPSAPWTQGKRRKEKRGRENQSRRELIFLRLARLGKKKKKTGSAAISQTSVPRKAPEHSMREGRPTSRAN